MIQLTERQALVFELLQKGMKTIKEISLVVGKSDRRIREAIEVLEDHGMVIVGKVSTSLVFEVNEMEFTVKKAPKAPEIQVPKKELHRIVPDLTGYTYNFSDQQRSYMSIYKKNETYKGVHMHRTLFAKKLGVPKLYVTIALGAMR